MRGKRTRTSPLTTNNNVLDLENLDSILHNGQAVEVAVDDDIGNVTMHKDLSWVELDNMVGWNARIGAA